MRGRTWLGLAALPVAMAGLWWLMLHGFLEVTAYLLAFTVLALVGTAAWAWRGRRRRWAAVLVTGALVIGGTVGSYGWELNRKLDNIHRVRDDALRHGHRPDPDHGASLNILLMGSDARDRDSQATIAESLADGRWDPGTYNSDSLMLVHIPADRKAAYVVSVPRDSWVPVHDGEGVLRGLAKINSAFQEFGPFGTWRTVENLTGLRIDHMAIIDFRGFRDLTTAIGGVDVFIPATVYDDKQHTTWTQGWHHIEGDLALKYVRQRRGLIGGDFDRVDRQQNFLRAVMDKVLADGTIGNPMRLTSTLEAITSHLTVDSSWSNASIRRLALSLRNLDARRVRFATVPLDRFDTIDGQSVNIIDEESAAELWQAVADDTLRAYLQEHPEDELGDPEEVR